MQSNSNSRAFRTQGAAMALAVMLGASVPGYGQITVGPWVFHDDAFADAAVQLDAGVLTL